MVHRGHGPRARVTVAPFGDVMALLLLLGEAEKAARLLAPATTRTDASATLVGLHLEALFRLHRFVELRKFCLHLDAVREARLPKPLREALRMWRSDGTDLHVLAAAP